MPTERLRVRRAHPSDRGELRAFLSRLSPGTVRARYLSQVSRMDGLLGERELDRLLEGGPAEHVVLLAVEGTQVRGVAEFVAEDDRRAEIAFVVEDAFQGRGIARRLVRRLEQLARERGIVAFTGDVAYGNTRATGLLRGTGHRLQMLGGSGGLRFRLPLEPTPAARSALRSAA